MSEKAPEQRLFDWVASLGLVDGSLVADSGALPFAARNGEFFASLLQKLFPNSKHSARPQRKASVDNFDTSLACFRSIGQQLKGLKTVDRKLLNDEFYVLLMAGHDASFWELLSALYSATQDKPGKSQSPIRSAAASSAPKSQKYMPRKKSQNLPPNIPSQNSSNLQTSSNFETQKPRRVAQTSANRKTLNPLDKYIEQKGYANRPAQHVSEEAKALEFLKANDLAHLVDNFRDKVLFEDPIRNGLLLCHLVNRVFNASLRRVCVRPKTYGECLENFYKASECLKDIGQVELGSSLQESVEEIMKGRYEIVFSLINSVDKAINSLETPTKVDNHASSGRFEDLSHMDDRPDDKKDDSSKQEGIVRWLESLKLLPKGSAQWADVVMKIRAESLLVQVVERVFGLPVPKVSHAQQVKRSDYFGFVFEFLHSQPTFPKRLSRLSHEVMMGNRNVILSVLLELKSI